MCICLDCGYYNPRCGNPNCPNDRCPECEHDRLTAVDLPVVWDDLWEDFPKVCDHDAGPGHGSDELGMQGGRGPGVVR